METKIAIKTAYSQAVESESSIKQKLSSFAYDAKSFNTPKRDIAIERSNQAQSALHIDMPEPVGVVNYPQPNAIAFEVGAS